MKIFLNVRNNKKYLKIKTEKFKILQIPIKNDHIAKKPNSRVKVSCFPTCNTRSHETRQCTRH